MTATDRPRPIEIAPRDGTWVLGIGPSGVSAISYRYRAIRWVEYPDLGSAFRAADAKNGVTKR